MLRYLVSLLALLRLARAQCSLLSVSECQTDPSEVIMTLPIPANQEAVTTCQLLCVVEDYCKYWRYDSDTQNCDLLKYPYLPSCGSVTAGAQPDFAECLSQDSGTCDDIVKENCELQGDILWQDPAVRDAYECQEFLQLLGPVYGGDSTQQTGSHGSMYAQYTCI